MTGKTYTATVITLLLVTELIINPIGEFPLNDDWAYSSSIAAFVNAGVWKTSDWQAIPFIPQFIAGISLSKLFGFSFTILRFISIAGLIAIIIVFDKILKSFNVNDIIRFVILLCFAFNPLALSLSNTFLPDVFTVLLTLAAFLFMLNFLQQFKISHLVWFIFFSILATLNRQTGIVLPLAFGFIYIIPGENRINKFLVGLLPLVLNLIFLFLYEYIATALKILPGNYHLQTGHILHSITHPDIKILKAFSYYFITSTIALGLFILPLTIFHYKHHFHQIFRSLWTKLFLTGYIALTALKVILSGNIFPFVGNMFYPTGTGPIILTGFITSELQPGSVTSKLFWITLNFMGALSFYTALVSIINNLSVQKIVASKNIIYLFFLICILYLSPICLSYANDRYLLFLLPFLLLMYTLSVDFSFNKRWLFISLVPLICFSVMSTHDYLSINKARWNAANYLTNELRISPGNIDGGFEFNGWYLFSTKNYFADHKGRWWWINDDTYIITPKLINGYEIEREFIFSSWISFDFNKIYVLKRIPIKATNNNPLILQNFRPSISTLKLRIFWRIWHYKQYKHEENCSFAGYQHTQPVRPGTA